MNTINFGWQEKPFAGKVIYIVSRCIHEMSACGLCLFCGYDVIYCSVKVSDTGSEAKGNILFHYKTQNKIANS